MPKIQTFVLFVIAGLLAVIAFKPTPTSPATFGDTNTYFTTASTATTETVGTTATQVLATNTGRLSGNVINVGTSTAYCKTDGNTTAASSTVNTTSSYNIVILALGSTTLNEFTIGPTSNFGAYGGDLNCIATATTTVAVTDVGAQASP